MPASDDQPPSTTDPALDDLLWRVTAYVHLIAETAMADTPLTVASSAMLIAVFEEPGMTVADISRRIPKAQQTISQVTGRLEKLGLIERRLKRGRGVGLYVTDAGRDAAEEAIAHAADLNAQLRDLLGGDRASALTELLSESHTILQDARSAAASPPRSE